MDINWVDKTTGVAGTPVNRKNLMEMQGFSNDTLTITETDTLIQIVIAHTSENPTTDGYENIILFKETGMVRKSLHHPGGSGITMTQITSQESGGVTTITKVTNAQIT